MPAAVADQNQKFAAAAVPVVDRTYSAADRNQTNAVVAAAAAVLAVGRMAAAPRAAGQIPIPTFFRRSVVRWVADGRTREVIY